DREDEDGDQPQPVGGHTQREHRGKQDGAVDPRILLDRRDDPAGNAGNDGEEPGRPGQQHGDPEFFQDQRQHRHALLDGGAPITLQHEPKPAKIWLDQRSFRPYLARSAARASGEAYTPIRKSIGSPGARWISVKTIAEPPIKTGTRWRTRRISNEAMPS